MTSYTIGYKKGADKPWLAAPFEQNLSIAFSMTLLR